MKGYLSLKQRSFTEFTERRSVFYGSAKPVQTEKEALDFIGSVRKEYSDATHNVYAYILRENNISRFSDDGEPHGTAGLPVLDVLRKEGITDAAVVITRYFGGILLGAGGLVRAYTASAVSAVNEAGRAEWIYCEKYAVSSDYSDYQKLSAYFRREGIMTGQTDYGESITTECYAKAALVPSLLESIASLTNGKATAVHCGGKFVALDVQNTGGMK